MDAGWPPGYRAGVAGPARAFKLGGPWREVERPPGLAGVD